MSQQWAREDARVRARARRLQATTKAKLARIPKAGQSYKSPITYTRLQYLQTIARAQHTNYNGEFLPEGEVTDDLQEEWFLIVDEALKIFEARLPCGKCGSVHDSKFGTMTLKELRIEMEEADPEEIRESDVEKWGSRFQDIEESYMAEVQISECWSEKPEKEVLLRDAMTKRISAKSFQTMKLSTEEGVARKAMTSEIPAEAFKTVEVPTQEVLAPKIFVKEMLAEDSSSGFSWEEEAEVEEGFRVTEEKPAHVITTTEVSTEDVSTDELLAPGIIMEDTLEDSVAEDSSSTLSLERGLEDALAEENLGEMITTDEISTQGFSTEEVPPPEIEKFAEDPASEESEEE